ncbi:MAG: phosphate signaling complex protein PhoU [Pseudomonadales bacterium]|jgi:phosphate transport system protein|nr:phosphate signaling complex protein PhoU [Pseudomonadales bacterium]
MANEHHTSHQFDAELEAIKSHVLAMGGLVERQIEDALTAIIDADSQRAEEVIAREKQVNGLELSVDEEATRILVRRQPAASDLRLVLVITKAVGDLERIGDESKKIAKLALKLGEEGPSPRGYFEVRHIGAAVREMLHDTLDAFTRLDVDAALEVVRRDKTVDQEYRSATRELVTYMMEDPRSISRVMNIMWALRSLERIGDHSRNIAEYVFYLVKGKDLRHVGLENIESTVKSWS